eukprot:17114-Heterococcus_DN1.PRE.2
MMPCWVSAYDAYIIMSLRSATPDTCCLTATQHTTHVTSGTALTLINPLPALAALPTSKIAVIVQYYGAHARAEQRIHSSSSSS